MSANELLAFDVRDYGAVGTDGNDDTAAIQAAINAANAAGGGTVFFPRGTFNVSSTLTVPGNNIHFWGLGASHSCVQSIMTSGEMFHMEGTGVDADDRRTDISFKGLWIAATQPGNTVTGFFQKFTNNIVYHDCRIEYFSKTWELGHDAAADSAKGTYIKDCFVKHPSVNNCINLVSGAILVVRDCFFNGPTLDFSAIIGQPEGNRNWDGLVVAGNTVENISRFIVVVGRGIVNARVTENLCEPDLNRGAVLLYPYGDCYKWVISNNTFSMDFQALNGTADGVILASQGSGQCYGLVVSNNVFVNAGSRGVDVRSGVRGVVISGNYFQACGLNISGVALNIQGGTRAIHVSGNVIDGRGLTQTGIAWQSSGTDRMESGTCVTDCVVSARSGNP